MSILRNAEFHLARNLGQICSGAFLNISILLAVAGCGASLTGETKFSDEYGVSSLFSPVGYQVSLLGDGRYRVTATGKPGVAPERLEKIAIARAAEYGNEMHKKGFQAAPAQISVSCGRTTRVGSRQNAEMKLSDYRVVSVDVTYADQLTTDPSVRPIRDTADALKAELQSEVADPAAAADRAAAVASECRR